MKSRDLHVVTAIANPLRYASRYALYERWAAHMLRSGVSLTVVELRYGERPGMVAPINRRVEKAVKAEGYEFPSIRLVELVTEDVLWSKENLLNIGIGSLPDSWRNVAWIDADVFFQRDRWAKKTLHELQLHKVVQPWSQAVDLGPKDQIVGKPATSFLCAWANGVVSPTGRYDTNEHHPGYAWACRRETWRAMGGLLDIGILGAGDRHMAMGLVGLGERSYPRGVSPGYQRAVLGWQARADRHVGGSLGYVEGTILHGWHGPKVARGYQRRWQILVKHQYDPATDLTRDLSQRGLLEWSHDGSPRLRALRRDVRAYFASRDEDATTLA